MLSAFVVTETGSFILEFCYSHIRRPPILGVCHTYRYKGHLLRILAIYVAKDHLIEMSINIWYGSSFEDVYHTWMQWYKSSMRIYTIIIKIEVILWRCISYINIIVGVIPWGCLPLLEGQDHPMRMYIVHEWSSGSHPVIMSTISKRYASSREYVCHTWMPS